VDVARAQVCCNSNWICMPLRLFAGLHASALVCLFHGSVQVVTSLLSQTESA
jgi:hypothetical protein